MGGRVYVEAKVTLWDAESGELIASVQGVAREAENKKGMDDAQITGAASSYARKYALNGLFCIDDTKDPDATNDHGKKNDKSLIQPGTETWDKVVNYLENGGSLVEVMKKYKLSPDQLNELNSVK